MVEQFCSSNAAVARSLPLLFRRRGRALRAASPSSPTCALLGQGTSRPSQVDPRPPPDLPRPGSQRVPGIEAVLHVSRCILVRPGWIGADETARHHAPVHRRHGGRESCTRRADAHLATPGGRLQACCGRIEAALAEMAGHWALIAWTWRFWQQSSNAAPPARELSLHRVSHGLTHAVSSSRLGPMP